MPQPYPTIDKQSNPTSRVTSYPRTYHNHAPTHKNKKNQYKLLFPPIILLKPPPLRRISTLPDSLDTSSFFTAAIANTFRITPHGHTSFQRTRPARLPPTKPSQHSASRVHPRFRPLPSRPRLEGRRSHRPFRDRLRQNRRLRLTRSSPRSTPPSITPRLSSSAPPANSPCRSARKSIASAQKCPASAPSPFMEVRLSTAKSRPLKKGTHLVVGTPRSSPRPPPPPLL